MTDTTPSPAPWCDDCQLHESHWHCLDLPHCAALHEREARNQQAREYAAALAQLEAHSALRGFVCGVCLSLPVWAVLVALLGILLWR
jgi:hypothetical protein